MATTPTQSVRTVSAKTQSIRIAPGFSDLHPDRWARRRRTQAIVLGVATPIVLLLLWEVAATLGWVDQRFFPSPTKIWSAAVGEVRSGELFTDTWATLYPLLVGLVVGFFAGCVLGFLMGLARPLRLAFDPVLSALYTVPKLALLPLLLLMFGYGSVPKVVLIALGAFFIIWISVQEAVVSIPVGYLETARSFRINPFKTFFRVIFPKVLPDIFVSLRIAVGNAVLIAVGIEFVNGSEGLGYRIWNSWTLFIADKMYVGIVVVALLGYVLRLAVDLLRRVSIPWALDTK
ncbi:MAG: ABC transporter permease [Microbacterium sp.]